MKVEVDVPAFTYEFACSVDRTILTAAVIPAKAGIQRAQNQLEMDQVCHLEVEENGLKI